MTFVITTDLAQIDRAAVHGFLSVHAPWSRNIPLATVERAMENSLCFAALTDERADERADERSDEGTDERSSAPLIGLARVVTDRATFAYLCDVFVLPHWRSRGVARALLAAIDGHPDLQGLRRFLLFTRDAHALYAAQGFAPLAHPDRGMERLRDDLYTRVSDTCVSDSRSNDTRTNDTRTNDTRTNDTRTNDTRTNGTRTHDLAQGTTP